VRPAHTKAIPVEACALMMTAAVPETLPERMLWTCSGFLLPLQQADPLQGELVHQAVQPRLCVQGPVDKLTDCCS